MCRLIAGQPSGATSFVIQHQGFEIVLILLPLIILGCRACSMLVAACVRGRRSQRLLQDAGGREGADSAHGRPAAAAEGGPAALRRALHQRQRRCSGV